MTLNKHPSVVAIIPARYGSTRFPGKPLVEIQGKTLIQRTFENAKRCVLIDRLIVATDDMRIYDHVKHFGGNVVMTPSDCPSGTDRLAFVVNQDEELQKAEIIINVQGDEPCLDPSIIDLLIEALRSDPEAVMSTPVVKVDYSEDIASPSEVKCVLNLTGRILYFSRGMIPGSQYLKDKKESPFYKHLGVYAYRPDFLLHYAKLPMTPLQQAEDLEQLKVLEHGYIIKAAIVKRGSAGVNTPEDISKVELELCKLTFIFVTGGVCSSLGKGLTAASIGMLLEKKGLSIAMLKLDPYLNVDPGTMSPYQHGEVYVTDDGAETDLDLGHYYRFTNSPLSAASNATSGQIYHTVIRRERQGDYLGKTVQVIPHITDEIQQRIYACAKQKENIDVVLVEIGGTVGDIESLPFLEAIRQFRNDHPKECLNIHLTYVPYLKAAGEVKTKPSQHSVQQLRAIGIFPDFILCRCEVELSNEVKEKIALYCNVSKESVIEEVDVKTSIYEVPLQLHEQNIDTRICERLNLKDKKIDLSDWKKIIQSIAHPKGVITVGLVGKYVQHQDAYKSILEALDHGAIEAGYKLIIKRFEADKIIHNESVKESIEGCDGYLIPGGFGERGWDGKILTAQYCRENRLPYFGICLGMQIMAIEFARHVAKIEDANSTEIDASTKNPVISLLSEQKNVQEMGGTMRLGNYNCKIKSGTHAQRAYGKEIIAERHRHRYELNNAYKEIMEKHGFIIAGTLEDGSLCEIAEIKDHPWMVGVQFHPEFKSKPTQAHPLFRDFIKAMIAHKGKAC